MFELKRTKDYVKRMQEKYPDLSEEDINFILLLGMKNLCKAMYKNMDIRIRSWGVIYNSHKVAELRRKSYNKAREDKTRRD